MHVAEVMSISRYRRLLPPLVVLGLGGILLGLLVLPASLAFDPRLAAEGILGQLGVTGPAALAIGVASLVNLAAGSVVIGALVRRPITALTDAILEAFVGAVILDVCLLYLLGGLGLFHRPAVVALELLVIGVGWRLRLGVFQGIRIERPRISPLVILIALGWSAPVLLQLASPVVPWPDVLPNHVAPVEHLRVFGIFDPLTTSPSPVYGPSRLFLGFVALQGVNAVVADVPAALAVSAFVAIECVLVAVGLYRLAIMTGGHRTGLWVLVTFMLTHPFARLADDRARMLAVPLAVWAIVETTRFLMRAGRDPSGNARGMAVPGGMALAATILMHPLIGAFTAATLLVAAAVRWWSRLPALGALVAGVALGAIPQGLVMLGFPIPAVSGLVPIALAPVWLRFVPSAVPRLPPLRRVVPVPRWALLVVLVIAVAVAWRTGLISAAGRWAVDLARFSPLVLGMAVGGVAFIGFRAFHPMIVGGLAVSAVAGILARAIPPDSNSLLLSSLAFELQKEVIEWAPIWLALIAARTIVALLSLPRRPLRRRRAGLAFVSAFVLVAGLPLRPEAIDPFKVGEYRISEGLAVHLGRAQRGFWDGYPDARTLIDGDQRAILEIIRSAIHSGAIDSESEILHVAVSYLPWAATPVAVFTGVNETVVFLDDGATGGPLDPIHTVGGRVYPLSDLDRLLSRSDPGYAAVLLEPAGLPADLQERIEQAGYQLTFADRRGLLYFPGAGG